MWVQPFSRKYARKLNKVGHNAETFIKLFVHAVLLFILPLASFFWANISSHQSRRSRRKHLLTFKRTCIYLAFSLSLKWVVTRQRDDTGVIYSYITLNNGGLAFSLSPKWSHWTRQITRKQFIPILLLIMVVKLFLCLRNKQLLGKETPRE